MIFAISYGYNWVSKHSTGMSQREKGLGKQAILLTKGCLAWCERSLAWCLTSRCLRATRNARLGTGSNR